MQHHVVYVIYREGLVNFKAFRRENGEEIVYDCYAADVLLGTIYPIIGTNPWLHWKSNDLPTNLVKLIGDEIERQDW